MITSEVMNGWSPSVITTASASSTALMPRRSDAAWPVDQSLATTTFARPKSTREWISEAS